MRVLVTGATGNVGSLLVPELIKRGAVVRIFTRKQPNLDAYPKEVEVAIGDLLDPESVARAMEGVDKLFLLAAVSPSELMEAMIGFGTDVTFEREDARKLVEPLEDVTAGAHACATTTAVRVGVLVTDFVSPQVTAEASFAVWWMRRSGATTVSSAQL